MKKELEREKVLLLAECVRDFVNFTNDYFHTKYTSVSNQDKFLRLKLIIEEFHFKTIANELLRLNSQSWEEKQTRLLIDRFSVAFKNVSEFMENNQKDLFIFSGRIYTIEKYSQLLSSAEKE